MSELATGEIESPPKLSRAPHVGVEPFTPPSGAHERRDRAVSMDCGLRAGAPVRDPKELPLPPQRGGARARHLRPRAAGAPVVRARHGH
eukprot:105039-Prorocentrum_minimum.AAC.1